MTLLTKEADTSTTDIPARYLLPEHHLCKVASYDELVSAEVLFDMEHKNLPVSDRVLFSQNFIKAAKELKAQITSSNIAKYACVMDTDLSLTAAALEARAALAYQEGSLLTNS